MKLKLPIARRVNLVDVGLPAEMDDPDDPSWVEVRQSTTGDELRLNNEFSESSNIYDGDGKLIEQKRKWNGVRMMAIRIYLTLAGAHGIDLEEPFKENSFKPVFTFAKSEGIMRPNMTEDEFMASLSKLQQPITEAIYNAVLLENDQWNPKA